MTQIQRCKRCVVPLSLPSVKVDEDGVCQFCKRIERVLEQSKKQANSNTKTLGNQRKTLKTANKTLKIKVKKLCRWINKENKPRATKANDQPKKSFSKRKTSIKIRGVSVAK